MKDVDLVQLSRQALSALADGDLLSANLMVPFKLGSYFVGPECQSTWRRRATQVANDPTSAIWITRAVVDVDLAVAVGRAGFHGPPDAVGMVEVGYAIDPAFRRRGYARSALIALLKWAQNEVTVQTVRATIRPDNLPSRRLVGQYGFVEVGQQWDDEDGLEIIFEVASGGA
jgi:RimJ/RimL family protein N-acetyltransferase